MSKCCDDVLNEQELALDEVRYFPETSMLTNGEDLSKHFEDLSRLESCDPLAPIYRIGFNFITKYNGVKNA